MIQRVRGVSGVNLVRSMGARESVRRNFRFQTRSRPPPIEPLLNPPRSPGSKSVGSRPPTPRIDAYGVYVGLYPSSFVVLQLCVYIGLSIVTDLHRLQLVNTYSIYNTC